MAELDELSDDPDHTIKKLVLLSQLAIFLDILPGTSNSFLSLLIWF